MEINPEALAWRSLYKLMIGSILPRPIGWISSVDATGRPNLAPYSFFNAVCPNPPHVLFCPNVREIDGEDKDSLNNVRAAGEFVANIVTEPLAAAMNITSAELPAGINEFEAAGLTPVPSAVVGAPRVAESPIHFECRVVQIVNLSDAPGGGSVVIGRVVHLHIDDGLLVGEDKINLERLQPIGRLAGTSYCRVTDVFDMTRPPSQITPKDRHD
jgi:flavin reductase (DIM6/NTAB) family NADH-FMN oxidoreductase RutF